MAAFLAETGRVFQTAAADTHVVSGMDCALIGFYVNVNSGGDITLSTGATGGTALSPTFSPAIGWHAYPASCPGGLHMVLNTGINISLMVVDGAA